MNQERELVWSRKLQRPRTGTLRHCAALLAWLILCGQSVTGAEAAAHNKFKPDQFLKSWLILKPIPVPREGQSAPDEETQKKTFAKDWFAEQGGEMKIEPRPG